MAGPTFSVHPAVNGVRSLPLLPHLFLPPPCRILPHHNVERFNSCFNPRSCPLARTQFVPLVGVCSWMSVILQQSSMAELGVVQDISTRETQSFLACQSSQQLGLLMITLAFSHNTYCVKIKLITYFFMNYLSNMQATWSQRTSTASSSKTCISTFFNKNRK